MSIYSFFMPFNTCSHTNSHGKYLLNCVEHVHLYVLLSVVYFFFGISDGKNVCSIFLISVLGEMLFYSHSSCEPGGSEEKRLNKNTNET